MPKHKQPTKDELLESIDEKLALLIRVTANNQFAGRSQSEIIRELYRQRYSNKEIAQITGAAETTVRARITELKKK
jgi:DNA-binding NarL/FixJ family response regulator